LNYFSKIKKKIVKLLQDLCSLEFLLAIVTYIIFQKLKKKNRQIVAGYKCDGCGQEPIKGGRFTCQECDSDQNQPNSGTESNKKRAEN
jgi:hypothetical protein